MLSYVESGIVKHLLTKDLPEAVICPLNLGSKERQLRNSDLVTTYAIIIIGFLLASIVFSFEMSRKLCHGELKKKKGKVTWAETVNKKTINKMQMIHCKNSVKVLFNEKSLANINYRGYYNTENVKLNRMSGGGLSAIMFNKINMHY